MITVYECNNILAHLKLFKVTFCGQSHVKVKQIHQNVCSFINTHSRYNTYKYAKYKKDKDKFRVFDTGCR